MLSTHIIHCNICFSVLPKYEVVVEPPKYITFQTEYVTAEVCAKYVDIIYNLYLFIVCSTAEQLIDSIGAYLARFVIPLYLHD